MFSKHSSQFSQQETMCESLLKELQVIWDELGESDSQKDAMLLEIEQMCLDLYKKKVDEAKLYRAQLQHEIADYEEEISGICAAIGKQSPLFEPKSRGNLKKEREAVISQLEEIRKLKTERKKQFLEVLHQLQNISSELYGNVGVNSNLDEKNLSFEKLEELKRQLIQFQNEKVSRLKQVSDLLDTLSSLCSVLGLDVKDKISEICPTMTSAVTKDVSDNTLKSLTSEVMSLREVKMQRMQKLQNCATSLLEMWNLMDTPLEEQQKFHNMTSKIVALESEFTEPNILSIDNIIYVEREVRRLEQFKSTKMKELVQKKKLELEEVCKNTHLTIQTVFPSGHPIDLFDSESANHEKMLEQIEDQISKTKEEAFSRKEILEKVEKWLAAIQEESWLEEYNRDDNRYNAGRGAHLALKRAEKARVLLSKIPGMIEALILKVAAWEKEREFEFLYNGTRLLSMLEDYNTLRQEKENEKQRQKEEKRLKGQLMAEHETFFGSKPSPCKSGMKAPRCSISTGVPNTRKFSVAGAMLQDLRQATLIQQSNKKGKSTSKVFGHAATMTPQSALKGIGIQSPITRKPLSPVSSTVLSKANINSQEPRKIKNVATKPMLQKSEKLIGTPPSKPFIADDDDEKENKTPKNTRSSVPTTPLTVPMFTVTTPDTLTSKAATKIASSLEYSFEELRAGFVLPQTHVQ
ncbi:65-kDa microtubule-associated protein 3-like [Trifolium pratense]|uniref:65-kDa microtubule-associated protein 3-like n=1 Tax=Trifolium pratense TaxID=57577 RepID=UPI001E694D00|nr:65-kDa microtubule-associated protein 3-like [Trifolium pratense]